MTQINTYQYQLRSLMLGDTYFGLDSNTGRSVIKNEFLI